MTEELHLPRITPRKSHSRAKSGEDMMDILVDDINRYEALVEREEIFSGDNGTSEFELQPCNISVSEVDQELQAAIEGQTNPQPESSRYKPVSIDDTESFILDHRNKNTNSKTKSDLRMFSEWCHSNGELRNLEDIPYDELNTLLARFFLIFHDIAFSSVRRRDGKEYEPGTLTGVMNSIDRYLKDKKCKINIKTDETFSHSRRVLEAKRKELKTQGKGNKKQRVEPLITDEIKVMYAKQLLGAANPSSLLNTVWLNNGVFFGFRGRQEHTTLLLGDLEFKTDASGQEFVEFNERCTKNRSGAKCSDQRAVTPKMFAQPDSEYCPVRMLKTYISKRPEDPNSRFYLRPLPGTPISDVWYSHQPVGKNKLGQIMKNMAKHADIMGRKVNHSTRKTFASKLLQSDRPNTEVAQLGGWASVSTLTHYNVPSVKQQTNASNIIAETIIPPCPLVEKPDEKKGKLCLR